MNEIYLKTKKVKFYLKNKKQGWASIVAIFNFGYKEDGIYRFFQYSPGEDIPIACWDEDNQRIKKGAFQDWDRINRKLNQVENDIINKYDEMVRGELEVTPETLREYITNKIQRKAPAKTTLIGFAENYIKTCGKNWKTVRHYGTTVNVLKNFSKSQRSRINFDDIDMSFYRNFVKYLEGLNLRINTIGGHIKNLKVFLRQSYDKKIHKNDIFKYRDFRVLQEEVDSIYLTKPELQKIFELDLSDNKTLDNNRDAFIIAAFTGLRFSDIENLKPENIGNDGIIKTTTIKTNRKVVIPIGNIIKSIVDKHYPKLPRVYSNQKFNDYIKIIAEKAGLTDEITITHSNGGIQKPYKIPKYKLVSTHTARRSFATNMMLEGVPISQIMLFTGHKTEKSFFKYIKIRPTANAEMLKNHPFFSFKAKKDSQDENNSSDTNGSNSKNTHSETDDKKQS